MARLCRLLGVALVASVASQYAPTAGPTVEAAEPTPLPTAELTPGPTAGPTPRPTIKLVIHNEAGRASKLQLQCTPEAGGTVTDKCVESDGLIDFTYDASEASLGAVLAFAAYGDYRVKGGTILDSFDSPCWQDHWQEEWGRPVGELSQYYYRGAGLSGESKSIFSGGDNLAFVAHLSNGTRGDTLVISFRGTQGLESISNWVTNLNFGSKLVRCPKDSCDKNSNSFWGKTKDFIGKAHGCGKCCCRVHSGFWNGYKNVARQGLVKKVKQIVRDAEDSGTPLKVIVTGHSLGGAMATMMAYDAKNRGIDVHALYTVGSPPAFKYDDTRKHVEGWRPFPYWRSTYGLDYVTGGAKAEDKPFSFRHVGVEIHGDGFIHAGPEGKKPEDLDDYGDFVEPFFIGNVTQVFGDGSGQDEDPKNYRNARTRDSKDRVDGDATAHHGLPYLAMHGSQALAEGSSCLPFSYVQGRKMIPNYEDASCAERCRKKTGSDGYRYYGPYISNDRLGNVRFDANEDAVDCHGSITKATFGGYGVGNGYGGDCDAQCSKGYCSFAEPSLSDYPEKPSEQDGWNAYDSWDCTADTGRICCCDEFQTNGTREVIYGGSKKKNHTSTGQIFAIAFIVVSIALLMCVMYCFLKCCRREKKLRSVVEAYDFSDKEIQPDDANPGFYDMWDLEKKFSEDDLYTAAPTGAGPEEEKGGAESEP